MSGETDSRPGRVAWGLRAASIALKAKSAGRVPLADAIELSRMWVDHMDGDAESAAALVRFLAEVVEAPEAAGEALLAFLDTRPEGCAQGRACEAVLAQMPDWTRRADCGLG